MQPNWQSTKLDSLQDNGTAAVEKDEIINRMRNSIEWDPLVALLRAFEFSDYEIGRLRSSLMVVSLSKEARTYTAGCAQVK